MKKIFTLLAVAAMALPAVAEVTSVEASITWPMVTSNVSEEGTTYSAVNNAVVSSIAEAYITAADFKVGSKMSIYNSRLTGELPVTTFAPTEKAAEATEGHTISFSFTTKEGYTFQPTGVAFKSTVIGTDGGNYDLTYTFAGSEAVTLQENVHPNRNNEANGYFSDVTLPITASANSGEFDLVFWWYNLNTNKQIGLADVIISGILTGDIETSAITDIAADENAPVEYFNLQGMRVENPANGLFIKRQGSKVSKVIIK